MARVVYAICFSLLSFGILPSCAKSGAVPGPGKPTDTTTELSAGNASIQKDVSYGSDPRQTMDVSLVAGRTEGTPFVVLIHGGAWSAGDKKDLQPALDFFYSRGINVANINYRLTTAAPSSPRWPDLVSDVSSAIAFLAKRAGPWKIRSTGYVNFGFSAGAHLSLLEAYSYDSAGRVAAVIGFGTPAKLNDEGWSREPYLAVAESALPPLTGQPFTLDTTNAVLKEISPYYAASLKPTLLIQGQKDQVVPPSESTLMIAALQQNGAANQLISMKNAGHTGDGASQADIAAAYLGALAWIKTYSH